MLRRLAASLAILALLIAAAGCGGDDDDSGGQASNDSGGEKQFKLGVSMIDLSNPFFVSMREAGLKAAEDYGVEASFQSADGSLEKQIGDRRELHRPEGRRDPDQRGRRRGHRAGHQEGEGR